jgi:two-component system response regulator BaeR
VTNHCILVVEDEPKLAAVLSDYLHAAGFAPRVAKSGPEALAMAATLRPAVVLLDVNLPGLDGIEVCRALRATSPVPVLMLTARTDEGDRILGFETGADDYLCKPYSPREVVARVRALLRRAEGFVPGGDDRRHVGGFALDEAAHRAWWHEEELMLTPVEFRLLRTLVRQPGRVFARAQLLDLIHPDFRNTSDRAIDGHIKNLRRKLQAAVPGHDCVVSVYGVGYRFDLPPAPRESG